MNTLGIIDGILTDDGDVWTFGAKTVFRKYVTSDFFDCFTLTTNR